MRNSFNIKKPSEKHENLVAKLKNGPLLDTDIAATLQIPLSHPAMSYMGSKTAFWNISFAMGQALTVDAIASAIPPKNGKRQEIELYQLIDRRFVND